MKATDYPETDPGSDCNTAIRKFAEDVFAAADDTILFSDYDRDGEDRDGDGDERCPTGWLTWSFCTFRKSLRVFERCRFSGRVFTNSSEY